MAEGTTLLWRGIVYSGRSGMQNTQLVCSRRLISDNWVVGSLNGLSAVVGWSRRSSAFSTSRWEWHFQRAGWFMEVLWRLHGWFTGILYLVSKTIATVINNQLIREKYLPLGWLTKASPNMPKQGKYAYESRWLISAKFYSLEHCKLFV
jgi:hypothetical protein